MAGAQSRRNGDNKTNGNGNGKRARTTVKPDTGLGLHVPRKFTVGGMHPYEQVEWEHRKSQIVSYTGKVSFEQDDVEFPKAWSQNATNIVAEKYFRGKLGTPDREWSVRQIVDRVVDSITTWGTEQNRFASTEDADA